MTMSRLHKAGLVWEVRSLQVKTAAFYKALLAVAFAIWVEPATIASDPVLGTNCSQMGLSYTMAGQHVWCEMD